MAPTGRDRLRERGSPVRSCASREGASMTSSMLLARQAEVASEREALVVDLDGTLVRTDTLIEAMLAGLGWPLALLRAIAALRHGRARFKQAVAALGTLDPALLPYNEE